MKRLIPDWKQYQEDTAEFFRSLGLLASTDATLQGVRTQHDIDVLVTLNVAGFEVRWAVECKHWKTPVTKLHVLALREILADLGIDRGIVLCEAGFQSGAIEAASLTNVQVSSLANLQLSSNEAIFAFRLRELYDRAESCRKRYWEIPKDIRIEGDLRPDMGGGYSGQFIYEFCQKVLAAALRGIYPIDVEDLSVFAYPDMEKEFISHQHVATKIELLISELEAKLTTVENRQS